MDGTKLVFPGPHPTSRDLAELFQAEHSFSGLNFSRKVTCQNYVKIFSAGLTSDMITQSQLISKDGIFLGGLWIKN
jgi:hypothetical protein